MTGWGGRCAVKVTDVASSPSTRPVGAAVGRGVESGEQREGYDGEATAGGGGQRKVDEGETEDDAERRWMERRESAGRR